MRTPEGVKARDIVSPPGVLTHNLEETIAASASPVLPCRPASGHNNVLTPATLKGDHIGNMKRTPQPNITQSKLTSLLQPQPRAEQIPMEPPASQAPAQRVVSLQEVEMDTSAAPSVCPPVAVGAPSGGGTNVTTDFLLRALRAPHQVVQCKPRGHLTMRRGQHSRNSCQHCCNLPAVLRLRKTTGGDQEPN